MLDKIQFLLSLQILGFCVFGGITLLLRPVRIGQNRFWGGVCYYGRF